MWLRRDAETLHTTTMAWLLPDAPAQSIAWLLLTSAFLPMAFNLSTPQASEACTKDAAAVRRWLMGLDRLCTQSRFSSSISSTMARGWVYSGRMCRWAAVGTAHAPSARAHRK